MKDLVRRRNKGDPSTGNSSIPLSFTFGLFSESCPEPGILGQLYKPDLVRPGEKK